MVRWKAWEKSLITTSLSPPLRFLSILIKQYASNEKQKSEEQKVNKSCQACKSICNSGTKEIKKKHQTKTNKKTQNKKKH